MKNTRNKNELLEENWCHVVLSLESENYVRPDALLSYFLFTLKSVELKHLANKGRRKEICGFPIENVNFMSPLYVLCIPHM